MEIPTTMQALVKARPGPGGIELREFPVPAVGPGDVLIRVEAAGLCGSDLHIKHWNEWARSACASPPFIPGHEFAGHVTLVGAEVEDLKPGDPVSSESHIVCAKCYYCLSQKPHLCTQGEVIGLTVPGGMAQFVSVPARSVVRLRPGVSIEAGAVIEPIGGPYRAIEALKPAGSTVLVIGCGPTGLFGIGWLRLLGAAHILATDLSPTRRELALKMGADEALDPRVDDVKGRVAELTRGVGLDALVDFSGSAQAIEDMIPLARRGGRMSLFGLPDRHVALNLPRDVIFKELRIVGATGREMFSTWFTLQALLASGRFRPEPAITHRLPLSDFEEAFAVAEEGRGGKVLLLPWG